MAKKNKKKRAKKKAQKQNKNLTFQQIIHNAGQNIQNGNPREAIDLLRFGSKKHGMGEEIAQLLFRAYLYRSDQLRKKNMPVEADAMAKQADEFLKGMDALSEEDMILYLSMRPGFKAFMLYSDFLKTNQRNAEMEEILAGHLFVHREFEWADKLGDDFPIKREAPLIREALPLMDDGRWEDALTALRPLPRKSVFAPVRLFCKGMTAFYGEKDADAHKAFSMIPAGFPLFPVARKMADMLSLPEGDAKRIEASARLPMLWDGFVGVEGEFRKLIQYLEKRQLRQAASQMVFLSRNLVPDDPESFCILVLKLIRPMLYREIITTRDYRKIAQSVLPAKDAERIFENLMTVMNPDSELSELGGYIRKHLKSEFKNEEDRRVAHAALLLNKVKLIIQRDSLDEIINYDEEYPEFFKELGADEKNEDLILIDMTAKALVLDPDNRDAYEVLANLPRPTRAARKKVEAALLPMLERFPDDPFPCLELASLYYENNAFRKAENILNEAMTRAPHDSQVADRHVIALLVSAEKNIQRDKFHLVTRDLERATSMESKVTAPYVTEKRIMLRLSDPSLPEMKITTSDKQMALFKDEPLFAPYLEKEMAGLPLAHQIHVLGFLHLDIENKPPRQATPVLKFLKTELKKRIKKAESLSSKEIAVLFSPIGKHYRSVYPRLSLASIFFQHSQKLLNVVNSQDVQTVYELIMGPDTYAHIKKDIKKRLPRLDAAEKPFFQFYMETIRHLMNETDSFSNFIDIINQAEDDGNFDKLRALSQRLAPRASGRLKKALSTFNFNPMPAFFPFGDPYDDDEWDDDVEDFFDELLGSVGEAKSAFSNELLLMVEAQPEMFVGIIEDMVKERHLKGLPVVIVRNARKEMIRSLPDFDEVITRLPAALTRSGFDRRRLSREAEIIIYDL